ncbi:unnamed protein product [Caretta caretta]
MGTCKWLERQSIKKLFLFFVLDQCTNIANTIANFSRQHSFSLLNPSKRKQSGQGVSPQEQQAVSMGYSALVSTV